VVDNCAREPRCSGCAENCLRVEPRYEQCKVKRLCSIVDPGILRFLYGVTSLDAYIVAQEGLMRGANALELRAVIPFPTTPDAFIQDAKVSHQTLLQYAVPEIAGRFRTSQEPCEFGGDGTHKRPGADHDRIEQELPNAFHVATCEGWDHVHRSAAFLERFFRIHPFVDGNGRVARLFVQRICRADGRMIPEWNNSPPSRREYVAALEKAHSSPHHLRTSSGLDHLKRWLKPQIQEVPTEDDF
jgi:fido (protein-threonine AMPylation protein)